MRRPTVSDLKREAKRMSKSEQITHTRALDIVAQREGFESWASLMKARGPDAD